ncbi:hypothetical protein BDW22DRAFT_489782 [Trametopsis cervina]|nr:hypothetical protein BDW22DRAFT_489782 [Trametopsis cervina]
MWFSNCAHCRSSGMMVRWPRSMVRRKRSAAAIRLRAPSIPHFCVKDRQLFEERDSRAVRTSSKRVHSLLCEVAQSSHHVWYVAWVWASRVTEGHRASLKLGTASGMSSNLALNDDLRCKWHVIATCA